LSFYSDIVQKFNAIPFLERMKAEGKIRFLGFSLHDDYETFEKILKYRDWDFCQLQYNYIDEDEQAGTKGYLLTEELGVPLIVMEPVRGGSLANLSDDITNSFKKVNPDASTASFALRWVADHKNVKVILSGMSSKEQVDDNLDTFCNYKPLNDEERKVIANAAEIINQRVGNKCTGCRYCMPCPKGVNIPRSFGLWNRFKSFGSYENCRNDWENNIKPEEKPENCVECGQCEKSCPQQINIRRDLKLAQEELDSQK
jgi:predicted aldo/keto reductase-like oxidoreductase